MARPPDPPLSPALHRRPDFSEEQEAIRRGAWPLAGVDEAGRGPLAGPVVAAAVILDPERVPVGLDDSKRLSPARREALFDEIVATALALSLASVPAERIDRLNILRASLEAMRRALRGLSLPPRSALVDGKHLPPGLPCEGRALVGGDGRSQSIAAASIVAKVARDRMMEACCRADGRYGFGRHMGYGTARHREAIAAHGAAARLHRMSFAPLKRPHGAATRRADDRAGEGEPRG